MLAYDFAQFTLDRAVQLQLEGVGYIARDGWPLYLRAQQLLKLKKYGKLKIFYVAATRIMNQRTDCARFASGAADPYYFMNILEMNKQQFENAENLTLYENATKLC